MICLDRPFLPTPAQRLKRRRRGFTLMETALATIIVGVGVMAIVELLAKGTQANNSSNDMTTAINLVKNVHEFGLKLAFTDPNTPTNWGIDAGENVNDPTTYNDVNDMDGRTFSPPIDARGRPIDSLSGWSQQVVVHSVDPNSLTTDVPNGTAPAVRITVSVVHRGQTVTSSTWYTFDGTPP
jgi:prepilin-type N-terminal cleavage/methylation domain-containing protein